MSETQALEALNAWHAGNKGRRCHLEIDTGFGAACWECTLEDVTIRRRVVATEVFFLGEPGQLERTWTEPTGWTITAVAASEEDWVGPEAVVTLALAAWADPKYPA